MLYLLQKPDITTEDWITLFAGVFAVLLISFLVTRFTKYGGGSDYGMGDRDSNDYDHIDFD